ncbi:TPR-like protein [Xylariaceae sp. FL0662B]|nr:TPR-like protein [Xylariaceae sp. FL0662B]
MAHPFSSTLDALQAHFAKSQSTPQSQPSNKAASQTQGQTLNDNTSNSQSDPSTQSTTPQVRGQNPSSGTGNTSTSTTQTSNHPLSQPRQSIGTSAKTKRMSANSNYPSPPSHPEVASQSQLGDTAPISTAAHGRIIESGPGNAPVSMSTRPSALTGPKSQSSDTQQAKPQRSSPNVSAGLGNEAIPPRPLPVHPATNVYHGAVTPVRWQEPAAGFRGPRVSLSNQGMPIENPVDPALTATDALLEQQEDLRSRDSHDAQNASGGYFETNNESRRGRGGRGGRASRKRGPRKAAEPTGDVKYRLNMASNAYMDGRLDEAIEFVEDAIRINAETYRAWTLLSSFLQEKGDKKGYFTAKVYAAHLQPKVVDGWLQCAEIGIGLREEFPEEADEFLEQAIFCYSSALRADVNHRLARHGRAALYFETGRIKSAAKDYSFLVERCVFDVYALRGLAEMSILLSDTGKRSLEDKPKDAIEAYRRCISYFQANGFDPRYPFDWQDIKTFVELLAYVGEVKNAIHELRSLSRWLLTRSDEVFWNVQDDDREWDIDNVRRLEVEEYQDGKYPSSYYGLGLPLDLRTKLAVYRLKLGHENEAMRHLESLDLDGPNAFELLAEHPHLLLEVAAGLYEASALPLALHYYEPLRVRELLDAESLVRTGRCYLDAGDKRQAEECFTAAIDTDESNDEASIDARYELAKMYEAAREEREAFILVNEAIRLQEAREEARQNEDEEDLGEDNEDYREGLLLLPTTSAGHGGQDKSKGAKRPSKSKDEKSKPKLRELKPKAPTRRRPKVFARAEELKIEEERRAAELAEAWQVVRDSRGQYGPDDKGPSKSFMAAAKDLIDDFRSYKEFYSWDRYLAHLGIGQDPERSRMKNPNLVAMAERLSHNLNPQGLGTERQVREQFAISYRGVPLDEWLDLFLEYAIGLAQTGNFQDAYKTCECARDASVFSKSKEDMFLIHVTWAACALRGRDEETCIAIARYFMREYQFDTDAFRMFAALSRLCPSPASWYASGPVQKYMLRQIKLMDRAVTAGGTEDSGDEDGAPSSRPYPGRELDVTLLMIYGHVLFISNSFTYALNYFLRAYSLDRKNSMVNLSVGHCYVHYALKRQSENRQYLLAQGFHFLHQYYELKSSLPDAAQRQEAHYNLARTYHSVGIPHIAAEYYRRALRDVPDDSECGVMGQNDLTREAAYNLQQICWAGGDIGAVKALGEKYLVI